MYVTRNVVWKNKQININKDNSESEPNKLSILLHRFIRSM